ncbi:MAG: hypothetical protein J6U54_00950 [Clostridiales bacterium]|nr:hypothetical protein [Clostridiales bacterium]
MWSDERDTIMSLLADSNERFPRICPCCGSKNGHIFFYKRNDGSFGSAWAWCSECQEYSHSRYLIPSWWQNSELFALNDLHGCPDNLDKSHALIDKWVNSLLDKNEFKEQF